MEGARRIVSCVFYARQLEITDTTTTTLVLDSLGETAQFVLFPISVE